ncbi:acetyl-CoA C-acyltransferase [Flavobacterium sp. HSC-61S13]|uniref:acetyl-CoA C-acyltransferase n=1 Tax=Flavobacterium sp. HSC-61S13 TaxID=2910963 RepID=UPI0020A07615|nr:acetyl-CoA C-acyltransferase [Flavobacterium sp. HSC-61S13]MCP1995728.1 acetyl-CoA C-acetyltransferase [Flavobacterium sp. HSC-61S13]
MKEVFIVAAKRTPIGGLLGNLSTCSAPELGAIAIRGSLAALEVDPEEVSSVYLGNGLSAGIGQSPARQAAVLAGIPYDKDATTINKVCASGLKAAVIGAQQIQLGLDQLVVTGGMESMSNVPHYTQIRKGNKLGHLSLTDGMIKDGLWDAYHDFHMGNAAEIGVRHFGFSREQLDDYALKSYQKAQKATLEHRFDDELISVPVYKGKERIDIRVDEDIYKIIPEKMPLLKPAFEADGLLTAANSSNINDGAAVLILASAEVVAAQQWSPLAKIIAYADGAQAPEWFTTAPAISIKKALYQANLTLKDIDFFEINEAYASVILSLQNLLNLDLDRVNIHGGAVALGHPIGASGARILVTLTQVLKQQKARYGLASICNGGGGSTTVIIENLQR